MFTIVVNEKGGKKKRIEFDEETITIGRVQGNHIMLPRGNVSKQHARLEYKGGEFRLNDLNSTNGTYINGRRITRPTIVKPDDKVYVGEFILSFEAVSPVASKSGTESEKAGPAGPLPVPKPRAAAAAVSKLARPKSRALSPAATVQQPTAILNDDDDDLDFPSLSSIDEDSVNARLTTPDSKPEPLPESKALPKPKTKPKPKSKIQPSAPVRPAKLGNAPNDDVLKQMVAYTAGQVKRIDTNNLPARVDEGTAGNIRLVLRDFLHDQKKRGGLPIGSDEDSLMGKAFRALVSLGPLTTWLDDPLVCEITITGPNTIDLRLEEDTVAAADGFESREALVEALACLQAGLSGFEDAGAVRYRLEDGAVVFSSFQTTGQAAPSAVIYKNISPKLTLKSSPEHRIGEQARAVISKALDSGERIAVAGAVGPYRASVLADIVRLIDENELVVGVERFPLIGFEGKRQIGLVAASSFKTSEAMAGVSSLIGRASDLNPGWVAISGTCWSDVPTILAFATGHGKIVAELPMGLRGEYHREFAAGLTAAGRVVSETEAAAMLCGAFDMIVAVSVGASGRPEVTRIYRTGMMGKEWSPKKVFGTDGRA